MTDAAPSNPPQRTSIIAQRRARIDTSEEPGPNTPLMSQLDGIHSTLAAGSLYLQTMTDSFPTIATTVPAPPEDDATSVGSTSSTKSEERRRRREHWRREHETQLKVDGTFPRRAKGVAEADRSAVSAKVVQHLGTKTTASLHTLPPTVSDSVRVRSNLLRTLGIQKRPVAVDDSNAASSGDAPGKAGERHRRIQSADGRSLLLGHGGGDIPISSLNKTPPPPNRSLLSNVRMNEELKYDSDEDTSLNNNIASQTSSSYSRFFGMNKINNANSTNVMAKNSNHIPRRRRLIISDSVEVVPIPMRSEYSNRIKERMYSNRVELSENAQRNVVEFEAEGWDASTVLDDETQFYKCPLTGELIHPVHLSYFNKSGEDDSEMR